MLQVANNEGCTPLHRAAAAGHANVVKQLLQKNADAHATDNVSCIPNLLAWCDCGATVLRCWQRLWCLPQPNRVFCNEPNSSIGQ